MTGSLDMALAYLGEKPQAGALPLEQDASARSAQSGHVEVRAPQLQTHAIVRLAERLAVSECDILSVSLISEHSYRVRQSRQGLLTAAETERVLRIARVAAEAERVFGSLAKSRRWLTAVSLPLGGKPLDLLGFDVGAREVEEELGRIDFGDFA